MTNIPIKRLGNAKIGTALSFAIKEAVTFLAVHWPDNGIINISIEMASLQVWPNTAFRLGIPDFRCMVCKGNYKS